METPGTLFMDECMSLKLLSECYNSDQNCVSCWVSPADTPSLVTGAFTLFPWLFQLLWLLKKCCCCKSHEDGFLRRYSFCQGPCGPEQSSQWTFCAWGVLLICWWHSSTRILSSWQLFAECWVMIPILVLRICAVRNSGHKYDRRTWNIIFITVLRPLVLLKYVKFSDQANTQSVSEKRAHGLLLTGILNSWHIQNVPTAEEQKTEKCVALTVTCNEWNSPREIRPGILEVSEPHPSFILLYDSVGLTGTDEGFAEPEFSLISEALLKKKKMKLQSQVSWAQDTKEIVKYKLN